MSAIYRDKSIKSRVHPIPAIIKPVLNRIQVLMVMMRKLNFWNLLDVLRNQGRSQTGLRRSLIGRIKAKIVGIINGQSPAEVSESGFRVALSRLVKHQSKLGKSDE